MTVVDKDEHHWFDCQLPDVMEAHGQEVTCPVCGLVWLGTAVGWRNTTHGTVREDVQQPEKQDIEPSPPRRLGKRPRPNKAGGVH